MNATSDLVYAEIGPERLDELAPLWHELRAFHGKLPWPFADQIRNVDFASRKNELLTKGQTGRMRIEIVTRNSDLVAYCISTISRNCAAELDSMYVAETLRGAGIGTTLVTRAIQWMDASGAKTKTVNVATANEAALKFYARFGFAPRTVSMQQRSFP